jgi:hypothetical protein
MAEKRKRKTQKREEKKKKKEENKTDRQTTLCTPLHSTPLRCPTLGRKVKRAGAVSAFA